MHVVLCSVECVVQMIFTTTELDWTGKFAGEVGKRRTNLLLTAKRLHISAIPIAASVLVSSALALSQVRDA